MICTEDFRVVLYQRDGTTTNVSCDSLLVASIALDEMIEDGKAVGGHIEQLSREGWMEL